MQGLGAGHIRLGNSTHWHTGDLLLAVGLVGELGEIPFWTAVPASEHKSWGWGHSRPGWAADSVGIYID